MICNRPLYEERYGKTFYTYTYNEDLFIVLDPNLDFWNITKEQIEMIKLSLQEVKESSNIFVFTHQLVWIDNDKYRTIKPNSLSGKNNVTNFWKEVFPLFNDLKNPVFFCAGDLGAGNWSSDYIFDKFNNHITFLATGMGEGEGDNYVLVKVKENSVKIDFICIGSKNRDCIKN